MSSLFRSDASTVVMNPLQRALLLQTQSARSNPSHYSRTFERFHIRAATDLSEWVIVSLRLLANQQLFYGTIRNCRLDGYQVEERFF